MKIKLLYLLFNHHHHQFNFTLFTYTQAIYCLFFSPFQYSAILIFFLFSYTFRSFLWSLLNNFYTHNHSFWFIIFFFQLSLSLFFDRLSFSFVFFPAKIWPSSCCCCVSKPKKTKKKKKNIHRNSKLHLNCCCYIQQQQQHK